MIKFLSIAYLNSGNFRQQLAYKELIDLEIMRKLTTYNPLLAGTIPIEIDISTSDLDIVCHCEDVHQFSEKLIDLFGEQEGFSIQTKLVNKEPTTIANFQGKHFPIELFGQAIPSQKQDAFRHMLIEHQILQEKDSTFTQKIIHLKKSGVKTEPAFAQLLGLKGNPYQALLKLEL